MAHRVDIHPDCEAELDELRRVDRREFDAIRNGHMKLEAVGPGLGYPFSSAVRDGGDLRELRPRQGRSRWRVLYATRPRIVLLALAPEAQRDPRGFRIAIGAAQARQQDVLSQE